MMCDLGPTCGIAAVEGLPSDVMFEQRLQLCWMSGMVAVST